MTKPQKSIPKARDDVRDPAEYEVSNAESQQEEVPLEKEPLRCHSQDENKNDLCMQNQSERNHPFIHLKSP